MNGKRVLVNIYCKLIISMEKTHPNMAVVFVYKILISLSKIILCMFKPYMQNKKPKKKNRLQLWTLLKYCKCYNKMAV